MSKKEDEKRVAEEKKAQEAFLQRKKEIDEKYENLVKELSEKGYDRMSYPEGSEISIPGPLFAKFINYMNTNKKTLENLETSFNVLLRVIDASFTANDEFVLELMQQHITNCEAGKTVTAQEMDKQDAKSRIKKVK